jgi:hypothetical protein
VSRVSASSFHPDNTPAWTHFRSLESLGSSFDAIPIAVPVRDRAEIERAIAEFARSFNSSLIFPPDVFTIVHRELIVGLVAQHRLPAVYAFPSFVRSSGLMSYGVDQIDLFTLQTLLVFFTPHPMGAARPIALRVSLPIFDLPPAICPRLPLLSP